MNEYEPPPIEDVLAIYDQIEDAIERTIEEVSVLAAASGEGEPWDDHVDAGVVDEAPGGPSSVGHRMAGTPGLDDSSRLGPGR